MPAAKTSLIGSIFDWQYDTIPNNVSCLGSEGKKCQFKRGKCLGGTTSINFMMYTRGQPTDYELSLPGWTWDEFRPYFLRYEGIQVLHKLPPSSIPYHNTSGVMRMEFFDDPQNEWPNRISEGFMSLNFPYNLDVNAISQIGVTQLVGFVSDGERMSTARAYLTLEGITDKLKILKETKCAGVIINERNVTEGVTILVQDTLKKVYAKHEVILSTGAVGTPQLLMLSGVGHAEHLKSMNIPVRVDLPVGDNMSDHVTPLIYILVERDIGELLIDKVETVLQAMQWIVHDIAGIRKRGFWASNGLTDITTFVNTMCYDFNKRQLKLNGTDCEIPTSQVIFEYMDRGILSSFGYKIYKQDLRLNNDITEQLKAASKNAGLIVALPVVLKPHSRGTVRLASSDPRDNPAIFPNYLGDKRDVDELFRMISILEHVVELPVFKKQNASILHLRLPGCPSYERDREGYWRCYTRHLTSSVYHAAGTCALGAVLDERMRVRGVRGLRVADLGALPVVPRGNTAAPAIALGERVADFLLQDNK